MKALPALALTAPLLCLACRVTGSVPTYGLEDAYADWQMACAAERDAWEPLASSSLVLGARKFEEKDPGSLDVVLRTFLLTGTYGGFGLSSSSEEPAESGERLEFLTDGFIAALEEIERILEAGAEARDSGELEPLSKGNDTLDAALDRLALMQISTLPGELDEVTSWAPAPELEALSESPVLDPELASAMVARVRAIHDLYYPALETVADANEVLEAHVQASLGTPDKSRQRIEESAVTEAFVELTRASGKLLEAEFRARSAAARTQATEEWVAALEARIAQERPPRPTRPARRNEPGVRDAFGKLQRLGGNRNLRAGGSSRQLTPEERRARALKAAQSQWDRRAGDTTEQVAAIRAAWRLEPLPDMELDWLRAQLEWAKEHHAFAAAAAAEHEASQPALRARVLEARAAYDQVRQAHMLRRIALLTGRDLRE